MLPLLNNPKPYTQLAYPSLEVFEAILNMPLCDYLLFLHTKLEQIEKLGIDLASDKRFMRSLTDPRQYVSIREAARIANVSEVAIYRLAERGKLFAPRLCANGPRVVPMVALERYIKTRPNRHRPKLLAKLSTSDSS